ncbi:MAG: proton-conducting transporter membrane subunit [Bacillota bacterium]
MGVSQIFPSPAAPAVVLAAGALVVMVAELAGRGPWRAKGVVALGVLALAVAALSLVIPGTPVPVQGPPEGAPVWAQPSGARLATDGLSTITYGVVLVAALLSLAISAPALDSDEPAAFVALLLLAAAGMGLLGSAQTLAGVFLGLELLSLSLYALVAYHRQNPQAREAAFKYLLLGSVASALLLFGIAMVYGSAGSLSLDRIAASGAELGDSRLFVGGFLLMLVGVGFKLALAPFHAWAPDAYQGAGLGVTAFMSVATKAAAFAALLRVAMAAPEAAQGVLWLLAALSMAVGSLGALRQAELRRLMAYSGIANAGYLMIALPHFTQGGIEAALFYLGSYALMNLGVFVAAAMLQPGPRRSYLLEGFEGATARDPLAGWVMVVFLLALVGMPLTGGFVGKVLLVGSAVREGASWLAFFLAASTAILAYPYLKLVERIVRQRRKGVSADGMAPAGGLAGGTGHARAAAPYRRVLGVAAAAAAVAVVVLGVWPEPLLRLARLALIPLG